MKRPCTGFVASTALLAACSMFLSACAAPDERADAASHDRDSSSPHSTPSPDRHPSTPPVEPTHYLVETEIYELPLSIAEDLYGRADERESTIGTVIDEAQCRRALEILTPTNPSIVRVKRTDETLELGKLESILPRERPSSKAEKLTTGAGSFASDYLGLQVRVTRSRGWPPLDLEVQIRWTNAQGRLLGRLPSATSGLPDGCWMQIVCLPSKREAASSNLPALFAFVRVTPSSEPDNGIHSQ